MTPEHRIASALESIAKSLSILAADTEANKELKSEILKNMNDMEKAVREIQEDPLGLNKGN